MKKTAFVFPGQGSQALGLLSSLASRFPLIESVFAKASTIIGYDIWALAQQGPIEKLNQTVYTQPLLLTASVALWQLWQSQEGAIPDFLVGHSLGEYTAYTCAGSFQLEEAAKLVAQRGSYMQASTAGIECAMAVIMGLTFQQITEICVQVKEDEVVTPSNHNAYDQVVISGHRDAVERVMQAAKRTGAWLTRRLPISVPAHCELMKPAARHLSEALESISCQAPCIPVVSNESSDILSDTKLIKQSLVTQLYRPVYWVDNVHYLLAQGVTRFVECGPGRVLTGLIRRIAPQVTVIPIGDYEGFQKGLST